MKYKLMNSGNIYQQMIWDLFDIEYERVFCAHTIGYSKNEIKDLISPYCREVMHKEAADAVDELLEQKRFRLRRLLMRCRVSNVEFTGNGIKRAARESRKITREV